MAASALTREQIRAAWGRIAGVLAIRGGLLVRVLLANLRPLSALESSWRRRHAQARAGLSAADPLFRPSRQWGLISVFFRLILRGLGLSGFKRTFGRFLAAYEPHNPRYFEALHHLYLAVLRPRDAWGLLDRLEEPAVGEGDAVVVEGRRVSLDLLQSVDEFYRIQSALGFSREDRVTFCELGSGYGRLAHVILSAMPNARALLFDLPESLVLSEYYLTALHPGVPTVLYPESVEALSPGRPMPAARLVFGLPHQLRDVPRGSVDVFSNCYSFMEMSREQIAVYFQIIDDLKVGALFLKQHKEEVNFFDKAVNDAGRYPVKPGWTRLYEGTSALYAHVFEAVYRVSSKRA